jgi:hypothetical protein
MNKYEIMRKIVLSLMCWNLILTVGLLFHNHNIKQQERLNQEICMLEEIPMEDLQ